jgi:hypothetical protein
LIAGEREGLLTAIGVVMNSSNRHSCSLRSDFSKYHEPALRNWRLLNLFYPNYGESPGGEGVIVEVGRPGTSPTNQKLITNDSLDELAALPGVIAVVPREWMYGGAIINYNRLEAGMGLTGVGLDDLSTLGVEAQGGTTARTWTAIIGSQVPNNSQSTLG